MSNYTVDPSRADRADQTGIYVRALRASGWDSVDIAELHRESLVAFLRSRGGDNPWAESVALVVLGFKP